MDHSAEFRRCLDTLDVKAARRLWQHVMSHLPQPANDRECLVMLHHARTQTNSIYLKLRVYSHRWLTDNGYPSGLPDELKPKAEQICPKIVSAVGISANAKNPILRPIAKIAQQHMSDVVMDAYADGEPDPVPLKARMMAAREWVFDQAGIQILHGVR